MKAEILDTIEPEKMDKYKCDNCGFDELVPEGAAHVIMKVSVAGHKYKWCPDCIWTIPAWRKHVNEDDLRDKNTGIVDQETTEEFNTRINSEMAKSQARLKELTRPKMEVLQD